MHIFLTGMMGAGKSTIGRGLARALGLSFVDLDALIEHQAERLIPEIFAQEGEEGFRRRETLALQQVCSGEPVVVATGGGVVLSSDNRALMRQRGWVVWLDAPIELLIQRVVGSSRPLVAGSKHETAARMRHIFASRAPLYAGASHFRVDAEGKIPQIVETLVSNYHDVTLGSDQASDR